MIRNMTDIWPAVAAERAALADDLSGLTSVQWETPSWCDGWTVRDVLAHMTSTARTGTGDFVGGLLAARFDFDRFARTGLGRQLGATPQDTLAAFRGTIGSTTCPPGPKASWLGEVVIHGEDIRRPLGIAHQTPVERVREVADFYKDSNLLIGAKKRIDALQLRATDTDWTHGTGPVVEGQLIDLLLAMTGRVRACQRLTGPGVDTLAQRCR